MFFRLYWALHHSVIELMELVLKKKKEKEKTTSANPKHQPRTKNAAKTEVNLI